tara:strand:+ start:145 stop:1356 length:1212 start_codon:yes stop_codon:yes gene_type:complete
MTEAIILTLSIVISAIFGAYIGRTKVTREKNELNHKINELLNQKIKLESEKTRLESESELQKKHHHEQIDLIKQEKNDAASTIKEATNQTIQPLVKQMIKDDEERKNNLEKQILSVRSREEKVEKAEREIQAEKFKKDYEQKYSNYSRGKDGEKILKELLTEDLHLIEGKTVEFQKNLGNNDGVPDTTVIGPKGQKLHIDSKFPLIEFDSLFDASQEGDINLVKQLEVEIGDRVIARIKKLSKSKYHDSKGSYPFTMLFLPSKALLDAAERCFEANNKKNKRNNKDFDRYCMEKNILVCDPHDVWSRVAEIKNNWAMFQSAENESEDRKFMDKWLKNSRFFYEQYFKFVKSYERTNEIFGETTKQIKNRFSQVAESLSNSDVNTDSQKIIKISEGIESKDLKE